MSNSTTFVDAVTPIKSAWLNDVNAAVYTAASGITGASTRGLISKLADVISVKDFGVVGDGVTDDTTNFKTAITSGGKALTVPFGSYKLTSSLTLDYSSISFPDYLTPSTRVSIIGASLHGTFLNYAGGAGTFALNMIGPTSMANLGVYQQGVYTDMVFQDSGHTQTRHGISITNQTTAEFRRLNISDFNNGMYINSTLSLRLENVIFTQNLIGTVIDSTTAQANPNAMSFDACEWNGNATSAIQANLIGTTNRFTSCRIENNGTTPGTASQGGMFLNINPSNGPAALSFEACYFEGNAGVADLYITNTGAQNVTVVVKGCTFNRTNSTKYVTNNIVGANSGGGTLTIVLVGCSFFSTGSYVPNAARQFFVPSDTKILFVDGGGNTFSESTSRIYAFGAAPMTHGRVTGSTGALLSGPAHISTSRSATGTYTITSTIPFAKSNTDYVVQFSFINGGTNAQAKWTNTSTTQIDLVVYNVLTGSAADVDFGFSIAGFK